MYCIEELYYFSFIFLTKNPYLSILYYIKLIHIMEYYVHLNIIVLDNRKLVATTNVIAYTPEEFQLTCQFCNDNPYKSKKKLFKNSTETRCFSCVPWGNYRRSYDFQRIGILN